MIEWIRRVHNHEAVLEMNFWTKEACFEEDEDEDPKPGQDTLQDYRQF